jgi:hypothetical protein
VKPKISFREAIGDPQLLAHCLVGPSWKAWRTLLIGAFGEPLIDQEELDLFAQLTGGREPPMQMVEELEVVAGVAAGSRPPAPVLPRIS